MILFKITFTIALLLMATAMVGLFIGFKDLNKFSELGYKITIRSLISATVVLVIGGIVSIWLKQIWKNLQHQLTELTINT